MPQEFLSYQKNSSNKNHLLLCVHSHSSFQCRQTFYPSHVFLFQIFFQFFPHTNVLVIHSSVAGVIDHLTYWYLEKYFFICVSLISRSFMVDFYKNKLFVIWRSQMHKEFSRRDNHYCLIRFSPEITHTKQKHLSEIF